MIANPNDGNSPQVEVATPTISVSAGGLITATTQQGKGYVPGGSKSATQQLTTQGAKTVTPGTTEQIAVASGCYTTGDVKVAGDANLVAENIAEGVSIFGVTGTLSGGGASKQYSVNIEMNFLSSQPVYISFYNSDSNSIVSESIYGQYALLGKILENSPIYLYVPNVKGIVAAIDGNYQEIHVDRGSTSLAKVDSLIYANGDINISVQ